MTLTWGVFREQVRRSILKDDDHKKWTDEQLLDFTNWALDAFCSHTAVATATSYVCDGSQSVYDLPENIYEPVDRAGSVTLEEGGAVQYLAPVYYTIGMNIKTQQGFYTWPANVLNCVVAPDKGKTLVVRYYAYYNHPSQDSDLITIPIFAQSALAYLVGAHALSSFGTRESMMAQYRTRPEAGTPEDHSLRQMQQWYLQMYEAEITRHPRQSRVNISKER